MDCTCDRCQAFCRNKPGWFLPGQIETVARSLHLTVAALFRQYLRIDMALVREGERTTAIYVLAPAIRGTKPGAITDPTAHGDCIWLTDGRCAIHAVKPAECGAIDHTTSPQDINLTRATILKQWMPYKRLIQDLYGKKLKPPQAVKDAYRKARKGQAATPSGDAGAA